MFWNVELAESNMGKDLNDLDVLFNKSGNVQREAYRVSVPGLTVRLPQGTSYAVNDLSATGMSLEAGSGSFVEGSTLLFDLLIAGRLYLGALRCKIVRCTDDGLIACRFMDLAHQNEIKLNKLVLELQKRKILER